MIKHRFTPRGVCSRGIEIELENGIIQNVEFHGGCAGNTQGVATLCRGMRAEEAIERLSGIRCGFKSTSCPDQLSIALKEALAKENA